MHRSGTMPYVHDNLIHVSALFLSLEYLSRGATYLKEFGDNYMRYMPISSYYFYTAPINEIDRITKAIKEYYFQDKEIGLTTIFQLRDVSKSFFSNKINVVRL